MAGLLTKKDDSSQSTSSSKKRRGKRGKRPVPLDGAVSVGGSGIKCKKISKSVRSGLVFPVTKFHRLLKKGRYAKQISQTAAVYMSAVIEYLSAELLELSGNACRDNKRQRLTPRHIVLAMKNDDELNQFCSKVTCPGGGVLPFVHPIRDLDEFQALVAKGANSVPLRPVRRISTCMYESASQ